MVCWDRTIFGRYITIWKSGIWGCEKNQNTEKTAFKVVQMKLLAMHISNQKLSFKIFTVGNWHNIFMEHDLYHPNDFWHKRKIDNFDPYSVFMAIATNIPQRLVLWSRVTYTENSPLHPRNYTGKYIEKIIFFFKYNSILRYYCFYCSFNQMSAYLVSIRDFQKYLKYLTDSKLLNRSVYKKSDNIKSKQLILSLNLQQWKLKVKLSTLHCEI